METTALSECERVRAIQGDVPLAVMEALVAACLPALSSPAVAEDLCRTVVKICVYEGYAKQVTCGAAGVIQAVVAAMSAHGAQSPVVAARGCEALARLALGNPVNGNAIVLSTGGLDVICSVMVSHVESEDVQGEASYLLWRTSLKASLTSFAAIRGSRAVELLNVAKANHPREGEYTIRFWANAALGNLSQQASDDSSSSLLPIYCWLTW